MKQAALVSKGLGVPFAIAEYPGAPMVDSDEELKRKVDDHLLPAVIASLTRESGARPIPVENEPEPGSVVFKGTLSQVEEHFHEKLWSDG